MESSFNKFHERYLDIWQSSSLSKLKEIISQEYQAREITNGKVSDFGYEESIRVLVMKNQFEDGSRVLNSFSNIKPNGI